jgi:euchromatic histone-lysine N-methyltransferase
MQKGCEDFTFPLATCIVLSGEYEDDVDNANEIIYTGQGGNNWFGNRQQKTAQTLVQGNLALKVSSHVPFDPIFQLKIQQLPFHPDPN